MTADPVRSRVLTEIAEEPAVLERCLVEGAGAIADAVSLVRGAAPDLIVIAARGSSAYAGRYLRSLVEEHLGVPVIAAAPSARTVYGRAMSWRRAVMVAISQSGQGPDVLAIVEDAVRAGVPTIGITNDPSSPMAQMADVVVPCRAGPEAIIATKSYLAQIALAAALVAGWTGSVELRDGLDRAPAAVAAALKAGTAWLDDGAGAGLEVALGAADRALVVSRGHDLATAHEVALKIAETSGIFAAAFSAADFLHGWVVLATPDVPVLAIRPDGSAGVAVDLALDGAAIHGAQQWVIGGPEVRDRPGALSIAPELPPDLTPVVFAVPGQLLAERVSRRRGYDPDRPEGLVKVIRTY